MASADEEIPHFFPLLLQLLEKMKVRPWQRMRHVDGSEMATNPKAKKKWGSIEYMWIRQKY